MSRFTSVVSTVGRNTHNRRITSVEDSIVGRISNEVDVFSSLGNTTVNQETETEEQLLSEDEGNKSNNVDTTETSVGMANKQLQDLLNNDIPILKQTF